MVENQGGSLGRGVGVDPVVRHALALPRGEGADAAVGRVADAALVRRVLAHWKKANGYTITRDRIRVPKDPYEFT